MKRLGLLRHAKSSWDDPALGDFDRPLNARGRAAAKRMGEEFGKLGLAYDLVLVSPARRAAETLAGIREGWGVDFDSQPEPKLYAASSKDLLDIIAAIPVQVERLLLVGHNPGLHELAMQLTKGSGSVFREALAPNLPTGSLVEIGLHTSTWPQAAVGGDLLRFLRPRELD
ncbi:MAG: histidine phosphatase family protein [Pseudomonadota bacterium]|nr:histidine phosphatase family protein [Sphingomonas sp.]MDQ3482941.1 histidine phosphatase family protein [Pseudomonadota bacterium]